MIIKLLTVIIIINLLCLNLKLKKNKKLDINFLFLRISFIIFIGFFFSILYRILGFFKSTFELNIKDFFLKIIKILITFSFFEVTTFFFIIYLIRKLLVFFFRKNFLILHFFFLSRSVNNYNLNIYNYYEKTIYFLCRWPFFFQNCFFLNFLLRYLFIFIMFFTFVFEIILNNMILHYFIVFLPYFGLYQFLISCNLYISNNIAQKADFIVLKVLYKKTHSYDELIFVSEYLKKLLK